MVTNENAAFFELAAAAVATMQAPARDSTVDEYERDSSVHVASQSRPSWASSESHKKDGSIKWANHLSDFLKPIHSVTMEWGLVDDWRPDGTVFKCHGIVLEVPIDLAQALCSKDQHERSHEQERIREAIEILHFVIALDPMALKHKLNGKGNWYVSSKVEYEDELSALARGIPWEVRVKMTVGTVDAIMLRERFTGELRKSYEKSDHYNLAIQRKKLLHNLIQLRSPRLERLAQLAAHSTIRVELEIEVKDESTHSVLASEDFFQQLSVFITDLNKYQSRCTSHRWGRHAPIRIEKITLQLRRFHITHRVLQSWKALTKVQIPVHVSRVGVDFRLVHCREHEFRKFVEGLTTVASGLVVDTGNKFDSKGMATTVVEAANRAKRVQTFVADLGKIKNVDQLDLGGILGMCTSAVNREAVWLALFRDVLSACCSDKLNLYIGVVEFTQADQRFIADAVNRWRKANRHKTLRLRRLEIKLSVVDPSAVRELLLAFDDVEEVLLTFEPKSYPVEEYKLSSDDLVAMLRYPSIRKISITRATIPTMDLFNPSVLEPRLQLNPVLSQLSLSRFQLEDQASLHRFLQQLKHTSGSPSRLENKLELLELNATGPVTVLDALALEILDDVLTSNQVLQHVVISVPDINTESSSLVGKLVDKHKRRFLPATGKSSTIAKARKIAFLSTMQGPHSSDALSRLDSTVITKIFQFSSNRFPRKMDNYYH